MKRGWKIVVLLVCFACVSAAYGQASAYAGFSLVRMKDAPHGDYLFGGTGGVLVGEKAVLKRFTLSGDVSGTFSDHLGVQLDGVTIGARVATTPVIFQVAPYVGFDVGFGSFNDGKGGRTTDNLFGVRGGVTHKVSPRLDAFLEYRFQYFGYVANQYDPQTISGGMIYHFTRR